MIPSSGLIRSICRTTLVSGVVPLVFIASCSTPEVKPIPPLRPESVEKKVEPPAQPARPGSLTRMPIGTLYQLVQNGTVLIYDVRPGLIYKLGHIPGAVSWPKNGFESGYSKHEPEIRAATAANTPIVIYCTDLACPDGLTVATALSERGHSVSVLQGGYEAWKIVTE